jgi:hypothetical protein
VYILGATYFQDVRVEFIINEGWHFTSVYGNMRRLKEHISFGMVQCEGTKEFLVFLAPKKRVSSQGELPPCCTVQLVINYRYKKEHYVTVLTAIQTITGNIYKVYDGMNANEMVGAIAKFYISYLRTDSQSVAR